MTTASATVVQRPWNYCNLLRDESLEGADALPAPDALEQFGVIAEDLGTYPTDPE